jgi:hypothetical protein
MAGPQHSMSAESQHLSIFSAQTGYIIRACAAIGSHIASNIRMIHRGLRISKHKLTRTKKRASANFDGKKPAPRTI